MKPSLKHPSVVLATWFASGYAPKAPGTWGSLAALPFAWVIASYGGNTMLVVAAIAVFAIGVSAANGYMALSGEHDPGPVVIDEVAGQWLTLAVVPLDPIWYLAGFVAFRGFDILKPWPIKRLEKISDGGFGVMIDDVGAAGYAALVLIAAQELIGRTL